MGKIKTVVMGDLEAEETARKKAEAKRAQKKAEKEKTQEEKEVKKETEKLQEELAKPGEPETPKSEKKSEPEKPEEPEPPEAPEKKSKAKKLDQRYLFPRGKAYTTVKSLVEKGKLYSPEEAITLVKKTSLSSFDGTVEVHLNLTEKNLRGSVSLPHGTGKEVHVKIADDALVSELDKGGKIDFDILVASPDMMPKLAKVAKILGPKGLMPNPKTNTISNDPKGLALSLAKGQVQWKTQPDFPIVHAVIGKVSFEIKKLDDNLAALLKSIGKDKIVSVYLKATMGPSIQVQL